MTNDMKAICLLALLLFPSFKSMTADEPYAPRATRGTFGRIERLDAALDELLAPDAKIEKLAEGLDWSEGPVWVSGGNYLLFSDVPRNVVWKWHEQDGLSEYVKPSGYTGAT